MRFLVDHIERLLLLLNFYEVVLVHLQLLLVKNLLFFHVSLLPLGVSLCCINVIVATRITKCDLVGEDWLWLKIIFRALNALVAHFLPRLPRRVLVGVLLARCNNLFLPLQELLLLIYRFFQVITGPRLVFARKISLVILPFELGSRLVFSILVNTFLVEVHCPACRVDLLPHLVFHGRLEGSILVLDIGISNLWVKVENFYPWVLGLVAFRCALTSSNQ